MFTCLFITSKTLFLLTIEMPSGLISLQPEETPFIISSSVGTLLANTMFFTYR